LIIQQEILWNILLGFRKQFALNPSGTDMVTALFDKAGFQLLVNEIPDISFGRHAIVLSLKKISNPQKRVAVFFVDNELQVEVLQAGQMNLPAIEFISSFISLCVMPVRAFKMQKAISILHLAQSIDGRMATVNHNSRWISNTENLIFVHRMRALTDAILIGANTLLNDKPALTVRYVKGPNPVKVIVGNSANYFTSILESRDRVIRLVTRLVPERKGIESILMESVSGQIHPEDILTQLFKQGIYSVYIEGGAFTISAFIREKAVDMINFYISPVILGSGISIDFQGIDEVDDAICLRKCKYFPMGEGMLITGCIKQAEG
jgi:diaminohydroxyphosphoribosylaminopyrimidine deaminase / 5-amino-6-(5-phosphoribosylamino)uracil reductase